MFLLGLGIFTLAYLGFGVATQAWTIVVLFVIYGAYQGVFRAVGKALATDLAPEELRASGVGLYSGVVGVATLIASMVGGQLWQAVAPTATFLYGAALAAAGAVLLAALVPRDGGTRFGTAQAG